MEKIVERNKRKPLAARGSSVQLNCRAFVLSDLQLVAGQARKPHRTMPHTELYCSVEGWSSYLPVPDENGQDSAPL